MIPPALVQLARVGFRWRNESVAREFILRACLGVTVKLWNEGKAVFFLLSRLYTDSVMMNAVYLLVTLEVNEAIYDIKCLYSSKSHGVGAIASLASRTSRSAVTIFI